MSLRRLGTMGYVDYFLIVWDFISYARDHDIMVGPGRGSAAGSLVAYSLVSHSWIRSVMICCLSVSSIRNECPCRILTLISAFERRQEVIDYVVRKYGNDCVVQIVTFGTLAARGVIRDVGRVMDLPYAQSGYDC